MLALQYMSTTNHVCVKGWPIINEGIFLGLTDLDVSRCQLEPIGQVHFLNSECELGRSSQRIQGGRVAYTSTQLQTCNIEY